MRFPPVLAVPAAFLAAAALSVLAAWWASTAIEARTGAAVHSLLLREGLTWTQVETNGLQVRLSGTAPTEALRFRVMNLTASLIDPSRIRDRMDVIPASAIAPPRFSVELLRNDDGISLIGLVPSAAGQTALADEVAAIAAGAKIADMLNEADYPAPQGWDGAVTFGLTALRMLPHSKISISPGKVSVTAISGSQDEKRHYETDLARARPDGLILALNISAPRPVLTPFTLRFLKDDRGARFDACSADTEAALSRILAAAVAAGMTGKADCVIGLGVPTPRWAEAAELGIKAVGELGAGSITFSDADVSLLAGPETPQATFDTVVGELQAALPDVFSLVASLPEKKDDSLPEGPAEFTASLSPDGQVQLRGRLTDAMLRDAVSSFAKAHFGAANVYNATRLDPGLPDGWPVRVLAGIEAMSNLTEGSLVVQPGKVALAGVTGSTDAQATITRILSGRLGQGQAFTVEVRYDPALDPQADAPTPRECVDLLNAVLARQKIAFAPGSAEIEAEADSPMAALADTLRRCPDIPMEIAGHTDSQGREDSNLALSQARAEAVLLGLQGRRVLVGALNAQGYGETRPIADNTTEAGREVNRRIEFTLAAPKAAPVGMAEGADAAAPAPGAAAPDASHGAIVPEGPLTAGDTTAPPMNYGSGDEDPALAQDAPPTPGAAPPDASGAAAIGGSAEPEAPYASSAPAAETIRPERRPDPN